jgi:hypothetical protein
MKQFLQKETFYFFFATFLTAFFATFFFAAMAAPPFVVNKTPDACACRAGFCYLNPSSSIVGKFTFEKPPVVPPASL